MTHSIESFRRLAAAIAYPGMRFEVGMDGWQSPPSDRPSFYLRVAALEGTCNVTGKGLSWNGRKWRLSEHMTDGEVVATAFKALITALEHEARELFTFQGAAVYDSHVDIYKLVALRKAPDALTGRQEPPVDHSSAEFPLPPASGPSLHHWLGADAPSA